jgi:transcriptional regulator with XRE-family HTH domain
MENEAFKQALGKLIFQLRSDRGISQEKLALDAEVDRTRVGEIERGEANATIDTLSKIANILGQKCIGSDEHMGSRYYYTKSLSAPNKKELVRFKAIFGLRIEPFHTISVMQGICHVCLRFRTYL